MFVSVTRKNVCIDEAPSVRAASSSVTPSSCRTGTTSRITNGMEMKIVTRTIEGRAKMIWIPWAAKNDSNQPPRPNSRTAIRPTITGETGQAGGPPPRSSRLLPGKRSRASTSATITPKTDVTITVMTMMTPVR